MSNEQKTSFDLRTDQFMENKIERKKKSELDPLDD